MTTVRGVKQFDSQCAMLANHFLPLAPTELRDKLAQHIQDSIEDWFDELGMPRVKIEESTLHGL